VLMCNSLGGETVATIGPVEGSGQLGRHAECPKVTDAIIDAKHHYQFDAFLLNHHI